MPTHARPTFAVLLLAAVTAASFSMCYAFSRPDGIKFSHQLHVGEEELDCSDCHGLIASATDLKTDHMPHEKTCTGCHEDEEDDCSHCHTEPQRPTGLSRTRLASVQFSHKTHVGRAEGDCAVCHEDVVEAEDPAESTRPEMLDECMNCHREDFRKIGCIKCHDDFQDLKEKPFGLFDHSPDFLDKHGPIAKGNMQVCSHCHQQDDCSDCHSRMTPMRPSRMHSDEPDRLFLHRADWITRHPMEARLDTSRCLTCHKQERCVDCHNDYNISASGSVGLGPHPASWLNRNSIDFHGTAARRNIATCRACHDRGEATNCIACHKVGASGGTPHPPGWSTRLGESSTDACRWCHQPSL